MQTSQSDNKLIALWLLASLVAVIPSLALLPGTLVGGEYIPSGNDAMYHARRILDTAVGERGFYQFDDMIHAPEGSWITWPWAYDYLMAQALRLGLWIRPDMQPMKFLAYVPVFWLLVNTGLMALLMRSVKLPLSLTAVVLLGFAISPLTQALHGVGNIDHHFMELTFVLLAIWSGLRLFDSPKSSSTAILFGVSLGISTAAHTSLFVLQIPVLAAVLFFWFQGRREPFEKLHLTGAALLISQTVVLLPSAPFQQFFFELTTFSWFHFYVAFCSAAALILMRRFPISRRNLIIVGGSLTTLAIPLVVPFLIGANYVAGGQTGLPEIAEVNSPLQLMRLADSVFGAARYYGYLILLAPVIFVAFVWLALTSASDRDRYFAIFALFGLVLLMTQFRFHPFGSWALLVGGAYFIAKLGDAYEVKPSVLAGGSLLLLLLLMQPSLRYQLFKKQVPGLNVEYAVIHQIFDEFAEICAADPGVVLSAQDDGHAVRYHTDCGVLANNFLLTQQHGEKVVFANRLLETDASEIHELAPYIDYVLVHLYDIYATTKLGVFQVTPEVLKELNPPLFYQLAIEQNVPPNFELVAELRVEDERDIPYAQVYRIHPPAASE